jgi:hypothetical protein
MKIIKLRLHQSQIYLNIILVKNENPTTKTELLAVQGITSIIAPTNEKINISDL